MSPDGATVYVTGQSWEGLPTGFGYVTVAYNAATGARVWVRRDIAGDARALAVSSDGTMVYVTGESYETNSDSKFATVAYDAASGAKIWLRRYLPTGWNDSTALALAASPAARQASATGYSSIYPTASDEYSAYTTAAYDSATGARVWARLYAGSGTADSIALGLAVSPDGGKVFGDRLERRVQLRLRLRHTRLRRRRRCDDVGAPVQRSGQRLRPAHRCRGEPGRQEGVCDRSKRRSEATGGLRHPQLRLRHRSHCLDESLSHRCHVRLGQRPCAQPRRHPAVRDREDRPELGNGEESIDYTTISYATS